jgi:hypothetical protein
VGPADHDRAAIIELGDRIALEQGIAPDHGGQVDDLALE